MLKAKVIGVGNSIGLTLPKEVLGKLKVDKGDYLYLVETANGYEVVAYDHDFVEQMEIAQRIMREDRNILKVLAK